MTTLKSRLATGELLVGTFLNLGSPLSAEICASAGFDWLLVDLEHGAGTEATLLAHLQAMTGSTLAPLVRVESNLPPRFSRALDAGAVGVMVPKVNSATEAAAAVAHCRYPPEGDRGVAVMNRAWGFGTNPEEHIQTLNGQVVTVVQIETEVAVENAQEIANVPGVDVLFVGPSDLSQAMGIYGQLDHPRFLQAVENVAHAATRAGKSAGVLLPSVDVAADLVAAGYRFIGVSSDSALLASAARSAVRAMRDRGFALENEPTPWPT